MSSQDFSTSQDFSIGLLRDKTSSKKSSGSDSDSDDHSAKQSSPAKRNREHDKSLVVAPTEEETEFRANRFPCDDFSAVKKRGVDCTVCGCKLPIQAGETIHPHIYLQVAVCKKCKMFYGKGDFSVDEDGTDKFCRWCGNGGKLFCCSTCTCVFCQKCIKQNLGRDVARQIDDKDSWDCFICDIKPLWRLRATCWGAKKHIEYLEREKRGRVKETLLELSEKKAKPPSRRRLMRRRSASTSDSEDDIIRPNSNKENSGTDAGTKRPTTSKPRVRKLFTQTDVSLRISSDSETETNARKARRLTKKLPDTQTDGVEPISSDSDFETKGNKKYETDKKNAEPLPKRGKVSENGISESETKGKRKAKQKPPFFESQAKEYNTGKRDKKRTSESSSDDSGDAAKESEKLTKSTGSRRTSAAGDAVTLKISESDGNKSRKKASKPVLEETDTTDSDESGDESKSPKGKGEKKPAFKSQAKDESKSSDSDNHSNVSFSSQVTIKGTSRGASNDSKRKTRREFWENSSKKLDVHEPNASASRQGRRSSCGVPGSVSEKCVKKRSTSADESFDVERTRSASSERAAKVCEDPTGHSCSDSSEEGDVPSVIDEALSSEVLKSIRQHCLRSRELGEALCKASTTLDSKVKSASNLKSTRNIVKVYKRLRRMSKCVQRNMNSLEVVFVGEYKNWKRTARTTRGKGKASASKPSPTVNTSISKVQADIAKFVDELQLWEEEDSTDDESVEQNKKERRSLKLNTVRERTSDFSSDNEAANREQAVSPVVSDLKKTANEPSEAFNNFDSLLTEEIHKSPSAHLETNGVASLGSISTQPYDYEKQIKDVSTMEENLQSSKTNEGNSSDMFSDDEEPQTVDPQIMKPSPETEKATGKKKKKKRVALN